jgi:hypothetical protein
LVGWLVLVGCWLLVHREAGWGICFCFLQTWVSGPVLSCPVLSCPVLSCPVLSCPVLSCPVLSCPVLSWSCPVQSFVLSCPVWKTTWLLVVWIVSHYLSGFTAKVRCMFLDFFNNAPLDGSHVLFCSVLAGPVLFCYVLFCYSPSSIFHHLPSYILPALAFADLKDVGECIKGNHPVIHQSNLWVEKLQIPFCLFRLSTFRFVS